MQKDIPKLYDLIDSQDPEAVYGEIGNILTLLNADSVTERLRPVHMEIVRLFNGDYPGYQASNTRYHNLEHTIMVALAAARLIHGCQIGGYAFDAENILLGLMAAFFHDCGLIQTDQDIKGTGAKYTIGHEERSVVFMKENLAGKKFTRQQVRDCAQMIRCTNLALDVREIPFRSDEIEMLGKIVGSADLLAQMADRHYLEKLLLLFREFEEAGIPDFDSEEELLRKTEGFYEYVARRRLEKDFSSVESKMRDHFRVRWGIQRDLYDDSIVNNIKYLKKIFSDSKNHKKKRFYQFLKRGGIVEQVKKNAGQPPVNA